jgi:hypothetical protein
MESFFKNIFKNDSGATAKSERKAAGRSLGGTKRGKVIRITIASPKSLGCAVSRIHTDSYSTKKSIIYKISYNKNHLLKD